jgi:hypothetical protein
MQHFDVETRFHFVFDCVQSLRIRSRILLALYNLPEDRPTYHYSSIQNFHIINTCFSNDVAVSRSIMFPLCHQFGTSIHFVSKCPVLHTVLFQLLS